MFLFLFSFALFFSSSKVPVVPYCFKMNFGNYHIEVVTYQMSWRTSKFVWKWITRTGLTQVWHVPWISCGNWPLLKCGKRKKTSVLVSSQFPLTLVRKLKSSRYTFHLVYQSQTDYNGFLRPTLGDQSIGWLIQSAQFLAGLIMK